MKGEVIRLVAEKGFGFIRCGKVDYFFHRSDFSGHWKDLEVDMKEKNLVPVEFEEENSRKGPRASNVRRADFPNIGS